jgi:hypothetical protein
MNTKQRKMHKRRLSGEKKGVLSSLQERGVFFLMSGEYLKTAIGSHYNVEMAKRDTATKKRCNQKKQFSLF